MCLAVPGRVLEILPGDDLFRRGRVSFGGMVREVNLACVPEARPDDFVLVHVGFALTIIAEGDARAALAELAALGMEDETPDDSGVAPPAREAPAAAPGSPVNPAPEGP